MATLPANVGWGGSLTCVGGLIYALSGDGKRTFFRYNIAANTLDRRWPRAPADVATYGGALTTDGTSIYAFQGKTTAFWRYDIAANTWTAAGSVHRPPPTRAARSSFVPGLNPQGRFTLVCRLPLAGRHRRRASRSRSGSTRALRSTTSSRERLTVTPTGGASCSTLTGPTLDSADTTTSSGIDDAVVYEWTCTVAAGAIPGSLTFSDSRDRRAGRSRSRRPRPTA